MNNFCSLGTCQSLKSRVSFMCPSLVVLRAPASGYLYTYILKFLKAKKGLLKDMETAAWNGTAYWANSFELNQVAFTLCSCFLEVHDAKPTCDAIHIDWSLFTRKLPLTKIIFLNSQWRTRRRWTQSWRLWACWRPATHAESEVWESTLSWGWSRPPTLISSSTCCS